MSYIPATWTATTLISARLLRHAEEQYAEAKSYLDAHNHDSRYFTETEADAKFFHLAGGDTLPAGLDADMIDGQHAAGLMGSALPVGTIVVWYGTDANVPSGWAICNGGSGTPDLRNKFIVGAGLTYSVGNTGGLDAVTPGAGSVTIASHVLTLNEIPPHNHTYYDYYPAGACQTNRLYYYEGFCTSTTSGEYATESVGGGLGHAHNDGGGSYVTITSENIDNRPPYYALYYIQKVS